MIETVGRIALWLLAAAMIGYGLINLVFRSDLKRADLLTRGDERRSLLGAAAGLALVALLLTGCVTSPPVYGDVPECERLIPDSLKVAVPGVPIPESEEAEPWMSAFVHVLEHDAFALSSANGDFAISGLAPGRYRFEAAHEALGEIEFELELDGRSGARVELEYRRTDASNR